ncbi:MAG: hypothetical protein Q7W45_16995 [Bacteroidota bacterium]|nr:hypothetical protein [Bacteroidota bacterium]MDP3145288.1 hypothetical protein [Bacteroidota bacterium]MDP3556878.1 hypothetical protein [Bacteroidota bacterium]
MKHIIIFFSLFFCGFNSFSQDASDYNIVKDTIHIPKENKTLDCEYLITTLKNSTTIQLIKASNNKYYLRIVTSENLYFGKTDMLEVNSNSKSFFAKETTNFELNKNTGYYIIEIYKNYIGTLKEDGITGYIFGKAVTKFSKQDCNQVKQMAKKFYEIYCAKK